MKAGKREPRSFTADIQHDKETFYRLARVQYRLYGAAGKVFTILCGAALIAAALFWVKSTSFRMVLIFFGCWTISCWVLPEKRTAERLVKAVKGDFPHTCYRFDADVLAATAYGSTTQIPLATICGTYEDAEYWYLFLNSSSAYMVKKNSLQPADPEGFETYLKDKTGCTMERVPAFITLRALCRSIKALAGKV